MVHKNWFKHGQIYTGKTHVALREVQTSLQHLTTLTTSYNHFMDPTTRVWDGGSAVIWDVFSHAYSGGGLATVL